MAAEELTPFKFVDAINSTKKNLIVDSYTEKMYQPFMTNRALSYFPDTIFYANEMNLYHNLDNKLQFDYLINNVRPKKRFSKWSKVQDDEDIQAVKEYFKYNTDKAKAALAILSPEHINEIKEKLHKGGTK